ncbi:hypothetical protein CCHR01_04504 [Colletotrichum chrysophilum]|uniref:Uncharacterized protein n=1 Tax=Colletotrichum chrysophilum TaxID=1836956 RepID=A0AAD9ASS5_9PEZI|nr:hypothetical protein CCHR01_04504 [Colletotrichum chrysophilum]
MFRFKFRFRGLERCHCARSRPVGPLFPIGLGLSGTLCHCDSAPLHWKTQQNTLDTAGKEWPCGVACPENLEAGRDSPKEETRPETSPKSSAPSAEGRLSPIDRLFGRPSPTVVKPLLLPSIVHTDRSYLQAALPQKEPLKPVLKKVADLQRTLHRHQHRSVCPRYNRATT